MQRFQEDWIRELAHPQLKDPSWSQEVNTLHTFCGGTVRSIASSYSPWTIRPCSSEVELASQLDAKEIGALHCGHDHLSCELPDAMAFLSRECALMRHPLSMAFLQSMQAYTNFK